jgi:hypothetical protein
LQALALPVGSVDTFEGSTTEGWLINVLGVGGNVPQPVVVPTGGPGGAGDGYLQLTADGGNGPGGKLVALNLNQWAGDYGNVSGIRMDVRNFGATDLALRLLFEELGPMGPVNIAASTVPLLLPAGSGWTTLLFPVGLSSLTALEGSVAAVLSNAHVLRIFHNPVIGFPPPAVAARLGIDNVQAVAVPEPVALVLFATGLAALARRRQRVR